MFQTDIIHFLQSFDASLIQSIMTFISLIGTIPFVLGFILAFAFAVDFKRGLVLINVVAWTSIFTFFFKDQLALPRPINIDPTVETVYFEATDDDLRDLMPQRFFSFFSNDLLLKTRQQELSNYGFPSGHVSVQFALWFTLFFLFKRKWIRVMGIIAVFLMMVSRIYIGHHFLADVIGGALLGFIISGLITFLIRKTNYLNEISHHYSSLSILWLPIFLVPFANHFPLWILGSLIGLNSAASLIILQKNFPVFHVIVWKRVLAGLISIVLIFGIMFLSKTVSFTDNNYFELLINAVFSCIIILAAVFINSRLNLIRFRF